MNLKKIFSLQKKDVGDAGKVKAEIATMGVIDKDGDVTLPGFFGKQNVVVVPVHDWNHVPIGKASVYEEGNKAVADAQMNLEIPSASDWFKAMKFDLEQGPTPLMEWSYGFKVLDGGSNAGEFAGQSVRFLKPMADGQPGCKIFEISPVLRGAGEGTGTVTAKGAEKFVDEAQAVLDAALGLILRGKSLADLRAKDGREISALNKEKLAVVADSLMKAAKDLTGLLVPVAVKSDPAIRKELARFLKLRSGI